MSATQARTPAHRRYLQRTKQRDEPTQTKTIRSQYAQRLRGRWAAIAAAIRTGVVERDAFGLDVDALAVDPPGPRDFRFARTDAKVDAFIEWLRTQTDREFLDKFGGQNEWIRRAYERGLKAASVELRAAGIATETPKVETLFRLPVHTEQLQRLWTRNFEAMERMTGATADEMRRVLVEGLDEGQGPREIARDLTDRVDAVGRTRANTIARTEVMHSHTAARSKEWDRHGVEQVGLLLAPGACPECQALKAGEPYPTDRAPELLPRHPNCRCTIMIWTGS